MTAMTLGAGVCLLIALVVLFVFSRLFRKVAQGKALIVSKTRKVDVTFTGQVVLPVLRWGVSLSWFRRNPRRGAPLRAGDGLWQ